MKCGANKVTTTPTPILYDNSQRKFDNVKLRPLTSGFFVPEIPASIAVVLYQLNIDGLAVPLSKRGYKLVTIQRKQKRVTNINMQPIDFVEPMTRVELVTY